MTTDREELENIERDRKAHNAREAQRILSEPIIDGFLKTQEAECLEGLKRLPIGTDVNVLQAIHHDLLAIVRFKSKLEAYINEYEIVLLQDRTGGAEGI